MNTRIWSLVAAVVLGSLIGASSARAFNASSVSDLEIWLKADAGITTNAQGYVTGWADQSGKNHNGTSTSSSNPRFTSSSSGLGSKPALTFDGTDTGISLGNLSASFPTAATLFVVASLSASDGTYNIFIAGNNPGNGCYWCWDGDWKAYPGVFRNDRINQYCDMPHGGSFLFQIDSSASLWRMCTNGVSLGSSGGDYSGGDANGYRIGYGHGAGGFTGDIAEILVYPRVLTSNEAIVVGAYLVEKYQIPAAIANPYTPGVDNASGATGVTASAAVLNGNLVRTGSSDTVVHVFYGTSDHGTDAAAWGAGHHDFGVSAPSSLPMAYNYPVSGLTPGTSYFYTYAASNSSEMVWSLASKTFITGDVWMEKVSDGSEIGLVPATVMVFRASSATNCPLTVKYTQYGGTAVSGQDFAALPGSATIPVGATNVPLVITPLPNWARQTDSTLNLTVASGGYVIGSSSNVSITIANQTIVGAPTNVWIATVAGNASTAANWSLGHVPRIDEVVLLGTFSLLDMTWDVTTAVGGWCQRVDYTGTVTIATTYGAAFPSMAITGRCEVLGGKWTHLSNGASETYRLRASIGGDFTVGAGASINVTSKGYSLGPGRGNGQNHNMHQPASHGGLSCYSDADPNAQYADPVQYVPFWKTYGSITSPTNLGSGAMTYGGGAIDLDVGGTTTLQGSLIAKGGDTWAAVGSGGSIRLCTGNLSGNGLIDASAGATEQTGGGGGRVAVIVTSGSSFGTVTNRCFGSGSGIFRGAAGTIYCESAAAGSGHGVLTIAGNAVPFSTNTVTPIPGYTNAPEAEILSLKYVTLVATNYANVALLGDLTMGNLFLTGDNVKLYLRGHTLTLKASYHQDWGTEGRVDYTGGGKIIWTLFGTVFVIH